MKGIGVSQGIAIGRAGYSTETGACQRAAVTMRRRRREIEIYRVPCRSRVDAGSDDGAGVKREAEILVYK